MHSWKRMVELLELVDRPKTLGFQADMAHTMLFTLGCNAPEDRLVPENFAFNPVVLTEAYRNMSNRLRPYTTDLHIAHNPGTVKGSGAHDPTGPRCLPTSPHAILDIV